MNFRKLSFLLGTTCVLLSSCNKDDLEVVPQESGVSSTQEYFYVSRPLIAKDESGLRAGVLNKNYRWTNGQTILVKIEGASNANKKLIQKCFLDWSQYANLNFAFVESGQDFIVNIDESNPNGYGGNSYLGNGCAIQKDRRASVMLKWGKNVPESYKYRNGLHEIGHVLGFVHEHQAYPIKWNKSALYSYLRAKGVSDESIENDYIKNYSDYQGYNLVDYAIKDKQSIMTYDIPASLTLDGFSSSTNFSISKGDMAIASQAYPYDKTYRLARTIRKNGKHFYCSFGEILAQKNEDLWSGFEAFQCKIFSSKVDGSVPLYRYNNNKTGDHFYTTSWSELGSGKSNYTYESVQGYVYPNQVSGSVPLYRYYNSKTGEHFYTTNWAELGSGKNNYKFEFIQCYVLPVYATR